MNSTPPARSPAAISSQDPLPLYFQVKRQIEERIGQGEFPVGSQLPAEQELCTEYAVGRNTLRKALELLEQEGVIYRARGKGSFVSRVPVADPVAAPHVARQVSIRCRVPSFLVAHWSTAEFRRSFEREFPRIALEFTNAWDIPQHQQLSEKYFLGMDFYFMPSHFLHTADRRLLLGNWQEVMGERVWSEIMADLPPYLSSSIRPEYTPHLLPFTFCPLMMVYNQRLFSAAGVEEPNGTWTEQEFIATCEALRDHRFPKRVHPFICELFSYKRWAFALYRAGGRIWNEDGTRCILDSPESLEGIRFLRELATRRRVMEPLVSGHTTRDCSLFIRNHVAIQLASLATVNTIEQGGISELGIAEIPPGLRRSTVLTEGNIAVSPHIRERSLVSEFMQFIRRPEHLRDLFGFHHVPVASQKGLQAIFDTLDAPTRRTMDAFIGAMPHSEPLEYPVSYLAHEKLENLIHHVWIDLEHAEEHCREICEEVNQEIRASLR